MRNFNKTDNNNINENPKIIIDKNNPNTYPDFNINQNFEEFNRFDNNIAESKEPDLEEQIPQDLNENEQEEEMIQQNDDNNNNKENPEEENPEEENPLNKRFLITDKEGNPIIIGGKKLFGMKLIPLIGEDGKEELDENGNIILIGPDGQPKSQDELEPILLDDDVPLVNEENRPFLGINGIPLINEYGNPILGPGELYDRNNKVVKGVLGILKPDNFENEQKMMINPDNNINNQNDNNEEEENNINNDINKKEIDFNKLRPLIGANGLPVRDSENNFVFLDENNKPVKNTGFYLLLDQNGKPVPNSKGQPILINSEGKPINLVDNDKNVIDNQLLNKMMNPNQKGNNINIINPQNNKSAK